jgi:eukaryotic-like serine/threonine-protein kinase
MYTNRNILLICGPLLLVILSCIFLLNNTAVEHITLAQKADNSTNSFLTYRNPTYGIKMQFPRNWILSHNGLGYNDIIAFYSPLSNVSDIFPEHVTVSRTVYSKNITLNEYTNLINNGLQIPAIRIVGSNMTTLSGSPAQMVIYSVRIGNSSLALWNELVFTVKNNKVYSISFIANASEYNNYLPLVQKMVKSFQITNITSSLSKSGR